MAQFLTASLSYVAKYRSNRLQARNDCCIFIILKSFLIFKVTMSWQFLHAFCDHIKKKYIEPKFLQKCYRTCSIIQKCHQFHIFSTKPERKYCLCFISGDLHICRSWIFKESISWPFLVLTKCRKVTFLFCLCFNFRCLSALSLPLNDCFFIIYNEVLKGA